MKDITILVVDDNEDTVKSVDTALKKFFESISVRSAADANMALKSMMEVKPDLVLLDIRLPGVGGETLCQLIRSQDALQDVPVIFVSAIAGELTERYKQLGVVDYIEKPFQMFDLKKRVEKALGIKN